MSSQQQKILVVDDETGLRELVKEILVKEGYACFTAENGEVALKVLAAEEIDLALLDVTMPVMGGLALFQRMVEEYPKTVVVFVSAVGELDVALGQVKAGAFDYLIKPITRNQLIDSVTSALESQRAKLEAEDNRSHLEDLVRHQSKALENKAREVRALNRMFRATPETAQVPEKLQAPETPQAPETQEDTAA